MVYQKDGIKIIDCNIKEIGKTENYFPKVSGIGMGNYHIRLLGRMENYFLKCVGMLAE